MTILEQIKSLLKLHGIDGSNCDRIDVALDKLYRVEMSEFRKGMTAPGKAREERKPKKETKVDEEHLGI